MNKPVLCWLMLMALSGCGDYRPVNQEITLGMDQVPSDTVTAPIPGADSLKKSALDSSLSPGDSSALPGKSRDLDIAVDKNVKTFKLFIIDLKRKVAEDRRIEVGTMIKFPLKKAKTLKDFYLRYNKIFTPAIKVAIAKTNPDQTFGNNPVTRIAGGKLLIIQVDQHFKITAIKN